MTQEFDNWILEKVFAGRIKPAFLYQIFYLEDEEYKALQAKIEGIYKEYPKVLAVFDSKPESELTKKECAVLIEIMELKNKLTDMEMQAEYFRDCYDSVGIWKKQGFYNGLTAERQRWRNSWCHFLHRRAWVSAKCHFEMNKFNQSTNLTDFQKIRNDSIKIRSTLISSAETGLWENYSL